MPRAITPNSGPMTCIPAMDNDHNLTSDMFHVISRRLKMLSCVALIFLLFPGSAFSLEMTNETIVDVLAPADYLVTRDRQVKFDIMARSEFGIARVTLGKKYRQRFEEVLPDYHLVKTLELENGENKIVYTVLNGAGDQKVVFFHITVDDRKPQIEVAGTHGGGAEITVRDNIGVTSVMIGDIEKKPEEPAKEYVIELDAGEFRNNSSGIITAYDAAGNISYQKLSAMGTAATVAGTIEDTEPSDEGVVMLPARSVRGISAIAPARTGKVPAAGSGLPPLPAPEQAPAPVPAFEFEIVPDEEPAPAAPGTEIEINTYEEPPEITDTRIAPAAPSGTGLINFRIDFTDSD